jgi:hypothetical protein
MENQIVLKLCGELFEEQLLAAIDLDAIVYLICIVHTQ